MRSFDSSIRVSHCTTHAIQCTFIAMSFVALSVLISFTVPTVATLLLMCTSSNAIVHTIASSQRFVSPALANACQQRLQIYTLSTGASKCLERTLCFTYWLPYPLKRNKTAFNFQNTNHHRCLYLPQQSQAIGLHTSFLKHPSVTVRETVRYAFHSDIAIHSSKLQVAGVWHLRLPESLYASDLFPNAFCSPERLWTYDDGTALSPGTGCTAEWRFLEDQENLMFPVIQITFKKHTIPGFVYTLKAFYSQSAKPIFSQWRGKVTFHSACIIGAAFERRDNVHSVQAEVTTSSDNEESLASSEGISLIDSFGRKLSLADFYKNTLHKKDERTELVRFTNYSENTIGNGWKYMGEVFGYRILGEDKDMKRTRSHFFSDKGPMKLYNYSINDSHKRSLDCFLNSGSVILPSENDIMEFRRQMEGMIAEGPAFEL